MSINQQRLLMGLAFVLTMPLLNGCAAPVMTEAAVSAGAAAGIYATKRSDLEPADTASQTAPHESWCYVTMGDVDCYAHPQKGQAGRLINVDPQNRYPLTPRAYHEDVVEDQ